VRSRSPDGTLELANLTPDQRNVLMNAARASFNLTSEEYYLHAKGKIDNDLWRIWEAGIGETVALLSWLQEAWRSIRSEYEYVTGFSDFIEARSSTRQSARNRNR
jgi:hypothetical protein